LDGGVVKEGEDGVGEFTSWECEDFVDGGTNVVEVGFFDYEGSELEFFGREDGYTFGFVLFDGRDRGIFAFYERAGLDHEWFWGPPDGDYLFVIETDGTGLYYDFRGVPEGGSTEPSAVYECSPK
jgi:hypothetical protein